MKKQPQKPKASRPKVKKFKFHPPSQRVVNQYLAFFADAENGVNKTHAELVALCHENWGE